MYADYVREATAEEMAIYTKVETAFDGEAIEDFFGIIADEDITDLLKDAITSTKALAIIAEKGLTVEEVCIWYFIS